MSTVRTHALAALSLVIAASGSPSDAMARAAAATRPTAAAGWSVDARVDALLKKMTPAEKVGQLVQYSAGQPTGPGTGRGDYAEMIRAGQIGSFLNATEPRKINEYQRIAVEQSRLRIPLLFGLDVIHGFKTEFPIPLGLASTWDPLLVEQAARVAAVEASAHGIRWTFSPMVDIARDPRWGRMAEGAGEDPFLGAAMAAAYVRGYQGTRLDAPDSIAACAKHYVGYGAAEAGRDYNTTEISEHTLREIYLPPFQSAVRARALSLMSAFNSMNGVPSTANAFTLKQVLRGEWGFGGLVVSDWNAVAELIPHGIALDGATAARKAFQAGVDMDMASSLYHDHLQQLLQSRQVDQNGLDAAVRHVLRVKFALGLFDHPLVDEAAAAEALYRPDSLALAQRAAERSLVLLRNESGPGGKPLLPLGSDVGQVAVIGPLGDDSSHPDGAKAEGLARVTLADALSQRLRRRVARYKGTGIVDGTDQDIADAVTGAQKADVVVLTLGEEPSMSGEAASRAHLDLPGRQQELLEAVVATGKPVVLVLFSGRPLTLPWAFAHVPSVIAAWFPGISAGTALARVLTGEAEPSGRLVVSWPRSLGQVPLYYNALNTGRPPVGVDLTRPPADGDSRWFSRYLDEQNAPQYPFGHGLSYTRFDYGPVTLSAARLSAAKVNAALGKSGSAPVLTAEADVKNEGERPGEDVVQLYLQLRGTSIAEPVRMLRGFQRVALRAGETRRVRFELNAEALALWTADKVLAVEPSQVAVWISPDSAQGTPARLDIER
ncbi:MAG: glycoside hydrolase family 3 N-terminal domain-containing protein [Methylotetracoccus sp.]